jgi:hypothetical protein
LIFLLDFFALLISVLLDLLHGFFVIVHHFFDLCLELLNLVLLNLYEVVVVLLFLVDPGSVLFEQVGLSTLVRTSFLLFLALELLIFARVFQHLSTVLRSLLLQFFVLLFSQSSNLFLVILFNVGFVGVELLVLV